MDNGTAVAIIVATPWLMSALVMGVASFLPGWGFGPISLSQMRNMLAPGLYELKPDTAASAASDDAPPLVRP